MAPLLSYNTIVGDILAGSEEKVLNSDGADGNHSEYAVTLAERVVSGGMPWSTTDVLVDCHDT